nr:MAG TPA: hypothetical protein [Caudoviricetes sp.]
MSRIILLMIISFSHVILFSCFVSIYSVLRRFKSMKGNHYGNSRPHDPQRSCELYRCFNRHNG